MNLYMIIDEYTIGRLLVMTHIMNFVWLRESFYVLDLNSQGHSTDKKMSGNFPKKVKVFLLFIRMYQRISERENGSMKHCSDQEK